MTPGSVTVVVAVAGADVGQNAVAGFALGCKYALIALGFVVVFRATGVLNLAQGSFVLVGAYLTYTFANTWELNFYVAILLAMAAGAVFGVLLEALVLRHLAGQPTLTVIMVTVGLLFVIDNLVTAIWGPETRNLGDPWTGHVSRFGGLVVSHRDLWGIAFTAIVLAAFTAFFRLSPMGLAMRATALDPEAAAAQGIRTRHVVQAAWAIAGVVAAAAGATLAAGSGQLNPGLGLLALSAFPAMILGGLESPVGAVVGGIVIGVVQQLTALLAPEYFPWVGRSFELAAPYVVMIVILLVRPYGLFGTTEVQRA